MHFSLSSLINVTFACCILTGIILLLLRGNQRLARFGTTFAVAVSAAVMLRFLIPVEFSFTKSVYVYKVFYSIYHFIIDDFTAIGNIQISICDILLVIWIIGIIARLMIVTYQYVIFYKFCLACPSIKNELILKTFSSVHAEMGKYKRFHLIHSDAVSTPIAFGIFKSFIIIPTLDFDEENWGYVLKHELTHFYHGHLLCKFLCEVMCCLYWWNPAVYLFRMYISTLLEMDVDTKITRSLNEEQVLNYLYCLADVAKLQIQRRKQGSKCPWALTLTSFTDGFFIKRCKFILTCMEKKEKRSIFPMIALGTIMTAFLLTSAFVIIEPSRRLEEVAAEMDNPDLWNFSQEGCFLLQDGSDTYTLYINWEPRSTWQDIPADDPNVKIYSSLEEAYENEPKK